MISTFILIIKHLEIQFNSMTAETKISICIPDSSVIESSEGPESPLEREPAVFGFAEDIDGEGEGEGGIKIVEETEGEVEGDTDGEIVGPYVTLKG